MVAVGWTLLLLAACRAGAGQVSPPNLTPSRPTPALTRPTDTPTPMSDKFDGAQAFDHLTAQMALGPRYPGSPGHLAARDYIERFLTGLGWTVERQAFEYRGFEAVNLIGRNPQAPAGPILLIGAHYDTRARADQSPDQVDKPVPGAVDGASGVAVLLELARVLDVSAAKGQVWLLFFDAEDNGDGGLPGWDWIVGSTHLAETLTVTPAAMVLVDMVGDADQQLYWEANSDVALRETLWRIAADLGFGEQFIPQLRHSMIDDHIPFVQRGIPAVDVIDFDYPYWHTVADSADKASPDSLYRVGRVLEVWLER